MSTLANVDHSRVEVHPEWNRTSELSVIRDTPYQYVLSTRNEQASFPSMREARPGSYIPLDRRGRQRLHNRKMR